MDMTKALEDYLETVYLLVRDNKVARVKDIAKARDVRMSSVTTAMRRLAEMGLIDYSQREYIDLTPEGEIAARRVLARHDILFRFFRDILDLNEQAADENACAMEHHLSDEAMDRLTRFFEFLNRHPEEKHILIDNFHHCKAVNPEIDTCRGTCYDQNSRAGQLRRLSMENPRTLADLKPSETGIISQVRAKGAIRQRLLDMGLLPNTKVILERFAPSGDPVWIKSQGFQLSLRRKEAEAVILQA